MHIFRPMPKQHNHAEDPGRYDLKTMQSVITPRRDSKATEMKNSIRCAYFQFGFRFKCLSHLIFAMALIEKL